MAIIPAFERQQMQDCSGRREAERKTGLKLSPTKTKFMLK